MIDVGHEKIAVHEARKLGIPVVAVVDTNCSPADVDYVIPGNDDAMRAAQLYAAGVADAVLEGKATIPAVPEGDGDEFVELGADGEPVAKPARKTARKKTSAKVSTRKAATKAAAKPEAEAAPAADKPAEEPAADAAEEPKEAKGSEDAPAADGAEEPKEAKGSEDGPAAG